MKCYVITIFLYGNECLTISTETKRRLEETDTRFYRLLSMEHFKFLGYIRKNEGFENLSHKRHTETKNGRVKYRVTPDKLWKLMSEERLRKRRQILLTTTKDKKLWRSTAAQVLLEKEDCHSICRVRCVASFVSLRYLHAFHCTCLCRLTLSHNNIFTGNIILIESQT